MRVIFTYSVGEDLAKKELDNIRVAHENLKNHYNNLKDRFEETIQECEDLHTKVLEYEVTVDNLHKKLSKADKDNQEMEKLQIKKDKLITENKLLRNEVENSRSDASGNKTKLKLCEKDLHNANYKLEKKQSELETKQSELRDFKALKRSEEKDSKQKEKKVEKKLKALEQREAKLNVEKLDLERNHRKPELNNCIETNKFWIVPSSASNKSSISSSMVSHWILPYQFMKTLKVLSQYLPW